MLWVVTAVVIKPFRVEHFLWINSKSYLMFCSSFGVSLLLLLPIALQPSLFENSRVQMCSWDLRLIYWHRWMHQTKSIVESKGITYLPSESNETNFKQKVWYRCRLTNNSSCHWLVRSKVVLAYMQGSTFTHLAYVRGISNTWQWVPACGPAQ